ncbi:MAG TPA: zinc ribbon domain-containing protein [Pyrinomonadaceae bacterium]|nr:zinc ribbon domain-containing protein [Pyrinomonadaceae bacterium]
MFCPNCASSNDERHHFCRTCGLRLDAIAKDLAEQKPTAEAAELLRRKKLFERLWKVSISIAGFVGFMIIVSIAVFYKLILVGPEILFGSAMGAVVLFALISAFFFIYSRYFLDPVFPAAARSEDEPSNKISQPTGKLLNESKFEPASVTEDSTELLRTPQKRGDRGN